MTVRLVVLKMEETKHSRYIETNPSSPPYPTILLGIKHKALFPPQAPPSLTLHGKKSPLTEKVLQATQGACQPARRARSDSNSPIPILPPKNPLSPKAGWCERELGGESRKKANHPNTKRNLLVRHPREAQNTAPLFNFTHR